MKYILILLITISFAQVPSITHAFDGEEIDTTQIGTFDLPMITSETKPLLDFTFKANECFKINLLIELLENWEETTFNDLICDEIIEVKITVEDKTIDYTAEEFMKRLGFKENKQ